MPRIRWLTLTAPLTGAGLGYLYSLWSISRGST